MKKTIGVGIALLLLSGGVSTAEAQVSNGKVSDMDNWKEGSVTVVYGSALKGNQYEIDKVNKSLGVEGVIDKSDFVSSEDVYKATGQSYPDNVLFSSLKVKKVSKGEGIEVNINESGGKILNYTPEMYENALITTGIKDVEVVVASNKDVTGDSAYGGIGKVAKLNGVKLDTEVTKTVQEELQTVSGINKELEGKEGYSQEQLNKAIAEAKTEIAEKGKEKELTKEEVEKVVNTTLEDNGLNNILSGNQINLIVNYFVNAQDKGLFRGENADNIIEGSKGLIKDIKGSDEFKKASDKAKELGNGIKDTVTSEGFWERIGNVIKQIFQSFVNLFK